MKTSRFAKITFVVLIAFSLIAVITFTGIYLYVKSYTDRYVGIACSCFPEDHDKIYALINYMKSSDYSLESRNNMVWTIGRLSDRRALPYLQALYTGEPCRHSQELCQYELSKAINRCGGKVVFLYADTKTGNRFNFNPR